MTAPWREPQGLWRGRGSRTGPRGLRHGPEPTPASCPAGAAPCSRASRGDRSSRGRHTVLLLLAFLAPSHLPKAVLHPAEAVTSPASTRDGADSAAEAGTGTDGHAPRVRSQGRAVPWGTLEKSLHHGASCQPRVIQLAHAALPRPPGAERGQTTNCYGNGAEEETHLVSSLQLGVELTEDLLQLLPDHIGENIQAPSAKATPPSATSRQPRSTARAQPGTVPVTPSCSGWLQGAARGQGSTFSHPLHPEIQTLLTLSPFCQSPRAATAGSAVLLPASAEQHLGQPHALC